MPDDPNIVLSQSPFGVVVESKRALYGAAMKRGDNESQSPFGVVVESKFLCVDDSSKSHIGRNRLSALLSKASVP